MASLPFAPEAIGAVIFDCDGVLVDSEAIGLDIELAHLKEIGLAYERDDYVGRFMGRPTPDWLDAIEADARTRTGRALPEGFRARIGAAAQARLEEALTAIAGAHEFAQQLFRPMAVASSSSREGLAWKLQRTGLHDLFAPHIYSTELVTHGKPAPDLFLLAAQSLQCAPAMTLVIEDSRNGILAARAAGMIAVGFCGGGHCGPGHAQSLMAAGAHHVAANYAELAAILRPNNQ